MVLKSAPPRGFGDFGLRNRHGRDGAQRCRGGVHDRRRTPAGFNPCGLLNASWNWGNSHHRFLFVYPLGWTWSFVCMRQLYTFAHLCVCLCDKILFYIVSMGYKQCIEIIISTDPICCESAMSKIPNHGGCGPTMGHRQTASQKGLLLFGTCYWAAKGDCACRLMLIIGFIMNPLTL